MKERDGARELGLVLASLAVLVRFVDGAPLAISAALLAVVAAAGAGQILGEWRPWRWPLDRLIMPALAGVTIVGIARLIAPAPWLAVVFVGSWALTTWIVTLETAPFGPGDAEEGGAAPISPTSDAPVLPDAPAAPSGMSVVPAGSTVVAAAEAVPVSRRRSRQPAGLEQLSLDTSPLPPEPEPPLTAAGRTPAERLTAGRLAAVRPVHGATRPPHPRPLVVRTAALGLAFLAFAAVGGFVPGGLAGDGRSLTNAAFVLTVALDALVGGGIGVRIAALGQCSRRDLAIALVSYAAAAGLGGMLLRGLALPRLFGPALLTLLVYIVTGFRESPRPIRRNDRLLRETAMLALAGIAAIAWGLLAR